MKKIILALTACFFLLSSSAQDIIPIIEVQGETDVSPYLDQEVTINGKVTEFFGDYWYVQDEFGAWNGIFVIEPTLIVPANPPYWNEPRQPEVGDELTLTGTVAEVDGNTELINVTLVEQTEFWLATPAGTVITYENHEDETLEGTRVRMFGVTVTSAANSEEVWSVSDGIGEVECIGIDDEADPFVGDVYDVYGALRQFGDIYRIHVGDIDVISLSVDELPEESFEMYPNPMEESTRIVSSSNVVTYRIIDLQGKVIRVENINSKEFEIPRSSMITGSYLLELTTINSRSTLILNVR